MGIKQKILCVYTEFIVRALLHSTIVNRVTLYVYTVTLYFW